MIIGLAPRLRYLGLGTLTTSNPEALMFTAVSWISILIANSLCSAMISLIFSVVYLICIPKKVWELSL